MNPKENETFDEWSKRVAMYEHGRALQMIAQGQDIDSVMEDMSRRIQTKLLHPIFKAIKESCITEFDAEASRREYEEKYLKFRQPVADHVVDD